jgi:hypothetical protein
MPVSPAVNRALAYETDAVIGELRALSALHARAGSDADYQVRDQWVNP